MTVLWVGHEAEAYILGGSNNFEESSVQDAGYERIGMRVSRTDSSNLTSTPDWTATNEIWHRFNYQSAGGVTVGFPIWAAKDATGQIVAQIITAAGPTGQFQIWNGATFTNIGAAFSVPIGTKWRYDIHFKGGASGEVQVYAGPPGVQTKIVDQTGAWGSAINIVRIYHEGTRTGGGFNTDVAHEIVQTTSTINTNSEIKPPTGDGTDTDGGVGGWANVDESVYSDTDFINLTAIGKKSSFTAAARTLTATVVVGATASCRAWYEPGGPTGIKPYLLISGTRYYGPTFTLDVLPKGYQYTWAVDPSTGVAFTAAAANSATLQWGWEAV